MARIKRKRIGWHEFGMNDDEWFMESLGRIRRGDVEWMDSVGETVVGLTLVSEHLREFGL